MFLLVLERRQLTICNSKLHGQFLHEKFQHKFKDSRPPPKGFIFKIYLGEQFLPLGNAKLFLMFSFELES